MFRIRHVIESGASDVPRASLDRRAVDGTFSVLRSTPPPPDPCTLRPTLAIAAAMAIYTSYNFFRTALAPREQRTSILCIRTEDSSLIRQSLPKRNLVSNCVPPPLCLLERCPKGSIRHSSSYPSRAIQTCRKLKKTCALRNLGARPSPAFIAHIHEDNQCATGKALKWLI